MAFLKKNLVLVNQSGVPGSPKMWIYNTTDTIADVNTADYFLNANDILTVNDVILVVSSTGGTPVHSFVIVNAVSSSTVDVSDGLTITATDSD
jgi:ClpP class serine protease